MKPVDYSGREPRFRPEEYFAGRGRATGIIQFRSSHPRRAVTLDIEGTWDGAALVLAEEFRFDDGEVLNRGWVFKKIDEHRYEGTVERAWRRHPTLSPTSRPPHFPVRP